MVLRHHPWGSYIIVMPVTVEECEWREWKPVNVGFYPPGQGITYQTVLEARCYGPMFQWMTVDVARQVPLKQSQHLPAIPGILENHGNDTPYEVEDRGTFEGMIGRFRINNPIKMGAHWTSWQKGDCLPNGKRQWTSEIRNGPLPGGLGYAETTPINKKIRWGPMPPRATSGFADKTVHEGKWIGVINRAEDEQCRLSNTSSVADGSEAVRLTLPSESTDNETDNGVLKTFQVQLTSAQNRMTEDELCSSLHVQDTHPFMNVMTLDCKHDETNKTLEVSFMEPHVDDADTQRYSWTHIQSMSDCEDTNKVSLKARFNMPLSSESQQHKLESCRVAIPRDNNFLKQWLGEDRQPSKCAFNPNTQAIEAEWSDVSVSSCDAFKTGLHALGSTSSPVVSPDPNPPSSEPPEASKNDDSKKPDPDPLPSKTSTLDSIWTWIGIVIVILAMLYYKFG